MPSSRDLCGKSSGERLPRQKADPVLREQSEPLARPTPTLPLPAKSPASAPLHQKPTCLLLDPVPDATEASARHPDAKVVRPSAQGRVDQVHGPLDRLRAIAPEFLLESTQEFDARVDGRHIAAPLAPPRFRTAELETREGEALAIGVVRPGRLEPGPVPPPRPARHRGDHLVQGVRRRSPAGARVPPRREEDRAGGLEVRQIRLLLDGGRQVPLVATDFRMPLEQAAGVLFSRRSQENLFMCLRKEFDLDVPPVYALSELDPEALVVNPAWRELDRRVRRLRLKLGAQRNRIADLLRGEPSEGARGVQASAQGRAQARQGGGTRRGREGRLNSGSMSA